MKKKQAGRREFMKASIASAAGMAWTAAPWAGLAAAGGSPRAEFLTTVRGAQARSPRIRFSAIGMNHGHINGQVDAVIRGGGQLASFFAKEADLAAAFAKRYPQARQARSEKEILEDRSIQLVVSASIPDERAPLGIEVMRHGKDFMSDKPRMTTLEQLAEVRRVQAEIRRIYSILYGERLENGATMKAGELVRAPSGGLSRRSVWGLTA